MKTDSRLLHSYRFAAALAVLAAIFQPLSSKAANLTWNVGNGSWTDNASWTPSQQPGSGDGVLFTGSSSDYTSALGANYTIFLLTANGTSGAGNLTIASGGNNTLTLSASGGGGNPAAIQINAGAGAISIQSALKLDPNDGYSKIISVENTAGLTLTQFATGTDGFLKQGNGTLYLNLSGNNTIGYYTTIERGTVELAAGNLLQDWNMGIADSAGSNGTLNIQSGSMEVVGNFYVGEEGSGTVNVNGGNLTLDNQVDIGAGNGTAVVNLNSGSLRQTYASTFMSIGGGAGSGELNIAGGEFSVSGAFSIGQNGSLNVSGGNTTIRDPSDSNYGISVSGSNAFLNLTGGTIAAGKVVLNGGAVFNLGDGTTVGNAQILSISTSQNDNGTLNFNHSSNLTLGAGILNGIAINQIGSGTTTLSGDIYTTETATISSGTLVFGGNSIWPHISIPTITNNSALVFARSSNAVFSGGISGTGSLTQNGSGMTILGGNNTYTGHTLVQNGTLSISSPQALYNGTVAGWVPANILVESGATLAVGIGSNSSFSTSSVASLLTNLASNATSTGGFQAGSFVGFNTADASGFALTPGNTVLEFGIGDSSQGALGVSKIGNGTLTLNASNTYTGDTRVTGGRLNLGVGGSLASGNLSVTGSGSIFALDYTNPGATFANISVANGGQIQSSAASINFTNSATVSSGTLAGPVGGSGTFLKTGNGTAVISGNLTHTGGTTIEGGTLEIGTGSTAGSISGNVAILQNGTLEFNRSNSITASNAFSGNGAISKLGNGTLTLDADSSGFAGTTTISAGTLQIGNAGATGSLGGAITANAGTTISYNTAGSAVLAELSGNGSLVQAGNGTLIVAADQTSFTGATQIQSGTLQLGNGGTTGSISGNITNNGTLALNRSDDFTFSNNAPGTGTLLKLGSNTVTLNTTQSNTGGTIIDAGTLLLDGNNRLATSGNLSINAAGTLDLGSNNQTLSTVSLNGGNITGAGRLTANSSFAIQSGSASALLAGTAQLVKTSNATFVLTGINTYSGKTIVEDGTLSFDLSNASATAAQALGTNADFDLGAALSTSGTLNYTGTAATFAKNIKALGAGNNTVQNSGSGLLTLTGTLTKNGTILVLDGGTGGIQVNGAIIGSAENSDLILNGGNITLNATNTYNGPTYLNNGATLTLAVANALPGDLIIDSTSAVAFGANQTIEALAGGNGSTMNIGSYNLTLGSNGADSLYEGTIAGTGSLIKAGANAIKLAGVNTYNGTTTINGGVLVFGTPDSLYNGDNSTWTGNNITVNNGGALALAIGAGDSFSQEQVAEIFQSLSSNATAGGILAGGSFGLDVTGDFTSNQSVVTDRQGGGAIGFVKLGSGTLTLAANNTYTGPTAIRSGTLALGLSDILVSTGNLTVQGGSLALGSNNQTFNQVTVASGSITGNGGVITASNYAFQSGDASANLSGNASFQKTTFGSTVLSGSNTYTGNTTISAGSITFLNASSLYGGNSARWNSSNITAASGSIFAFGVGGNDAFSSSNLTSIVTNLTQNQTTSGGIAAGVKIGLDTNGSNASISTEFKNRTGTGSGNLTLVKLGAGTLSLTGNNSYTGGTFIETGTLTGNSLGLKGNITNNGTLLLGTYGTYQTEVSGNGNLLVGNGANVILTGNATMTGGTTIQSGTLTIGGVIDPTNPYSPSSYRAGSITGDIANEGSLAFDLASLAGTRTYNGTISGNGSLKTTFTYPHYPSGANGTLRLTGNNTFTGGTSVSIGTLDISGGTLASTGSVTVSNIGTLAIGSSNQTIGNFTINYGAATGNGSLNAQRYDLQHGSISLGLAGTADIEKNTYSYSPQPVSYDNGRVYLTGNNTSSGNITINSGILSFDNVRSLYSGNNASWTKEKISVSANATLVLGTGSGGLTDGFNNAQITDIFSNLTQNGTGGLAANSKIGFNTTSNFTLTTTITDRPDGGVLGLDKIGGSTLTLDANNTFTGELSVFEGTIALGRSNALRTDSDLVVDSKSDASYGFNVGNYSQQFVDITLKEGLLAGGSGAFLATGNYTMIKGNATANLSGNASLIKTNTFGSSYNVSEPEIVFLSGNNSYTGRTVVDGLAWSGSQYPSPSSNSGAPTKDNAKLQFQTVSSLYGGNNTLWTPENISVDSYGIFALRTGSAGFNATQVSTIIQNLITANRSTGGFLDKSVLGIDTNGENLVINDDIRDTAGLTSGGGAVGLVKYGSGTLTLNGNSTRSFSTSVTGGNLVLGANATLSSASANLLVDNARLDIATTNQIVRKVTVTSGSIIGSGTLTSSADGFVFGSANITASLAGAVGAVIDSYSSTTTLSGNNSFTGNTTIGSSATLSLANVNALAGSTLVFNYGIPAATLQLSVAGTNTYNLGGLTGTGNLSMGANSLSIGANSQNTTYSAALTGTGSLAKVGNGTLTFTGNNTYTGGTTISVGSLAVSSTGGISHAADFKVGNATGDNGTLTLNGGSVSNAGGFIGYGNESTGTVNINSGNWTNSASMRVGFWGNGTLNLTGGNISNTNGVIGKYGNSTGVANVSGGTWSTSGYMYVGDEDSSTGTLNLTGGNVVVGGGNITIARENGSTGTLNLGTGSTVGSLQAARVTGGNGTSVVNFNHTGNYSFAPILVGNLSVNKLGSGTTILFGNNTYTGGTFITAGTLQGSTQNLQGAITTNGSVVFNQTTNGTYSGVLSGSGEFAKTGAGTLTVSGNSSSFNGTAAINSGIVSLTGSMANASTTINNGGTLTGNGSLGAVTISSGGILTGNGTAGVVTINSGGAINPGNSPGRITVGNSIWNGGGIYNWELASANGTAGTGWDLIDSSGNLTITANSSNRFIINANTSNASGFNPNVKNGSWKIAEFAGGILGFDPMAFTINATGFANLPSMYAFGITQNGTALNFSYATVATWIGGTGNWTNTANWETGFAAINGVAVDYAGTNGTSTNNSDVTSIGGLTFTNNASGSFTLAGGALSIGTGGVTNNSNSTQTVAINLTLAANQTLAANTANLVVSGNISGNASLTKAGNKTLTFTGSNTYTGETNINAGTLAVASGGSLTGTSKIFVGNSTSDNALEILGSVGTGNLTLSHQVGSNNNSVTVGNGTSPASLTVSNLLNVGFGGTGNTLNILGNGTVTAGSTEIGGYGANNTLNLTGGNLNSTGYLVVGYYADGNALNITSGGNATVGSVTVGLDAGSSNNTILVSGSGSVLHTPGLIYLGQNGTNNSLLVQNGGKVVSGNSDAVIGFNAGSNGNALSINGTGSEFTNNGTLYIGRNGSENTLTVQNGASLVTSNSRIGHEAVSSNNTATVSGASTTWANTGTLRVGNLGSSNTLAVTSGANVTISGDTFIGHGAGSDNNLVSVEGAGSTFKGGNLTVGLDGASNILTVSNSGNVSLAGALAIGYNATSSNNTAAVSGAGSVLSAQNIQIGIGADNKLTVADSGLVSTANIALAGTNATLQIGEGGAAGNLSLTGSILTSGTVTGRSVVFNHTDSAYQFASAMSGDLAVSQIGAGTTILAANNAYSGTTTVRNGTLEIAAGGSINSTADTLIGTSSGDNATLYLNGGSVSNAVGYLGNDAGSVGAAIVSAGNWTNSGQLYVGNGGTGNLAISGGTVSNQWTEVAALGGGSGSATVSGGIWNSGNLYVGVAGNGTLNLSGGAVNSTGATVGLYYASGEGSANISGGTWTNTGDLNVGMFGNGSLMISGGNVTNINASLGNDSGSNGSAMVSGGAWTNSGNLAVGVSGTGSLTINGTGTVIVGDTLSRGSNGTINLESGGTLQIGTGGAAGTLATDLTNNGTLIFDRSSVSTYSGQISGTGAVIKNGNGTLILTGSSTYTGNTSVNAGTLEVNSSLANTATTLNSGGTLAGIGSLGNVTINSGGAISPGNSPGTITVGNSVWNGGGIYNWQLGNATGTAGTGWDLITSTGSLTIGANATNKFVINASALDGAAFDSSADSYKWQIANFSGNITGFSTDKFEINPIGFGNTTNVGVYSVSANATALALNYRTLFVWDAGNGTWSTDTNWLDNALPLEGAPIEFAGLGGNSTNNYLASISRLAFTANASQAYTLAGGNLSIGAGGIVNNSSHTQTIGLNIALGANQTIAANNANLVVSGNISGAASLTKEGNQTLTLSSSNSYTGGTIVDAGTLEVSGGVGSVSNNAILTVLSGGTVGAVTNNVGASGTNAGTVASLANAGNFTNSGNITGNTTTSGMLNNDGRIGGTLGVNGGTATIGSGGQVVGTSTVTAGTLDVSGRVANVSNNASFTVQSGGLAGSVDNLAGAIGTNNGTVAALANAGTFTNGGNITGGVATNGALTSNGRIFGTLGVNGGSATIGNGGQVSGATTVNSGSLVVSGTVAGVSNNASLTVQSGGLAGSVSNLAGATGTNNGTVASLANSGTFTNGGNITGGVTTNGAFTSNGRIGGTLGVNGGSATIGNGGQVSGATTLNSGSLVVSGTVAGVSNNASFTVQSGGLAGSVSNLAGATGTNNGTVASLANSGTFTNGGNIAGSVTTNGALTSSGNIGGAITIGGGEATISGTVAGSTTISAGVLQGNGTLGSLTLNSGGTIAPGTGNGTAMITVGNSVWNGGGFYNWQTSSLNGTAGTNWDLINSAGALTLNATTNQKLTLNLFTLGNASLTDVKKAAWEVGNFAQGITGFAKNAFALNADEMAGKDGRFFMSLGANNTTLVLNYKSAATWITGSGNWATLSQWEDEQFPENGDEVEFAGPGGTSTNNFASGNLSTISGLNFVEGAGAYIVNGNTLQIGEDGIINASSNLQTIGMNLTAVNELVVNTAAGDIAISGGISGNSSLTKTGNATLKLTGTNTYTAGTLVSAGTLAGTTAGLQGAIVNNAVVNFDQTFTGTYAGAMSGTGSLTKSGAGVVLLSGNNSYSGGTTINSGVLAASVISGNLVTLNPNAFGSGSVNINAGAAMFVPSTTAVGSHLSIGGDLTLNNGTIAFYDIGTSPAGQDLRIDVAGNFTNAGGGVVFDFSQVEALDSGNYTLVSYNGTNFATSAISSRAGVGTTLQGSFSMNGSSLVYTVLGAQSSGTDIQNNGGPNTPIVSNYTINQTGVVTIGQNNTVAALTFNSGGTLNIQSNGVLNVTSGTLNVQNGSSVVGGGTLVAPAGLNKDGAGELDFTNNVVVTGTAAVNAGLLSVNGQLSASSVIVNPTATLGGAGVIVAQNVVVNGNLAPGNSPGTLNVVGNLVLTGANSTIIEIASPTNFDRIVVSGTATLGGTLNALAYGGGTITPGTRYEFLEAGSIVGEFDSIVAPEGLRIRFLNSGTVGTLLFGPAGFVPYALNPNQISVASALDSFVLATEGDALTVGIALDSLTTEQFPAAFDQIMPGFYESLANIAIEQAFGQTQMLNQRISSVRLGAAGFQAIGGISQPLVNDKNGKSAADAKDANPIVESATTTNWNAWALGTGMFSRSTNLGSLQNYNNDAGGFLVGSDYRWSENFVTGLYAGYDYSYAKYNGGSSTRGNSMSFGTYASYEKDGYYADAVIGGGFTGYQTRRAIQFGSIDRIASADPNSGQFTAGLNLGKDFEVGKFTLGPIVGAQYTYAGIGSFTESGADSLDLALGQQNANSLRSTLGGRIAYTWNLNPKVALIPEVRMFWQHEFLNNPRTINSSLNGGAGPSFGYETITPYRDSVFAGAGVTAQFGKNLSGSVFYNINFGSQTYQSNMVSAGLNLSF